MITQIKGRLVEKSPTELVVDCNGVGYSINISLNTFSQLNDEENIKLFTHLIYSPQDHRPRVSCSTYSLSDLCL